VSGQGRNRTDIQQEDGTIADTAIRIMRLIDMGVKPFLVASSIQTIMTQRFVRYRVGGGSFNLIRENKTYRIDSSI
jgi:hypothetical protein